MTATSSSTRVVPSPAVDATPAARSAFLQLVEQLVHAHRAQLARVARSEGLGAEDAFDAVQDAFGSFLVLPEAAALADAPDEARRLLIALTRNQARNRRRLHVNARPHSSDAAVVDALASDAPNVQELLEAAEDHLRLFGCVRSLGDVQRTVVTLRMLDGRDGEDVARAMGITPGHVAVLLHRAKRNLTACMTGAP